jgi:hypothetical protein
MTQQITVKKEVVNHSPKSVTQEKFDYVVYASVEGASRRKYIATINAVDKEDAVKKCKKLIHSVLPKVQFDNTSWNVAKRPKDWAKVAMTERQKK